MYMYICIYIYNYIYICVYNHILHVSNLFDSLIALPAGLPPSALLHSPGGLWLSSGAAGVAAQVPNDLCRDR